LKTLHEDNSLSKYYIEIKQIGTERCKEKINKTVVVFSFRPMHGFIDLRKEMYIDLGFRSRSIYEGCSKSFANRYTENTQSIGI